MSFLYISNKPKKEQHKYYVQINNTIEKYYKKLEDTRNQYRDLKVKNDGILNTESEYQFYLLELKYEQKLINSFKQLKKLDFKLLNERYKFDFDMLYLKIDQVFRTPAQESKLKNIYNKVINKF